MLNAGFTTLDYLKSRLLPEAGTEETQWDAALSRLGLSVAGKMQRFCNRTLERVVDGVWKYDARTVSVVLHAYPVEEVASVELVQTDGSESDAGVDYQLDEASGVMEFTTLPGSGSQRLKITFTGGYWLDPMDGTELPDGATAFPEELLEAFVSQCQTEAMARNLFEAVAVRPSKPGESALSTKLSDGVVEVLNPYRRFAS